MKKLILVFVISLFLSCGGGRDDPAPQNPQTPAEGFAACAAPESDQTLEIMTWNIENFPMTSTTIERVLQIIADQNPDVIAVQEITSLSQFNDLLGELSGWTGNVIRFNQSNLMLGYLYKNSEVTISTTARNLFPEQSDENDFAFTAFRRPLLTKIRHSNGMEINLINVHLKCCDGSENRRRAASEMLKGYIDANLATEEVIVLGDFNDEIVDARDNVFQNFLDDAANYRFATIDIAQGSAANWSFPSFPSHIDQILITDELFETVIETRTLLLDDCINTYLNTVSDHRPVIIRLNE